MDNKTPQLSGYGIDVIVVPMASCLEGFGQFSLRGGADWAQNDFALENMYGK
jgi:hypothetical protein